MPTRRARSTRDPACTGHSLGKAEDAALQKRILGDALALVRAGKEPGKLVSRDCGA